MCYKVQNKPHSIVLYEAFYSRQNRHSHRFYVHLQKNKLTENNMELEILKTIVSKFAIAGNVEDIKPLGNGLINSTYKVTTHDDAPDYVLQCINHAVFPDIDLLMRNIIAVTNHIRKKLTDAGETDIERKCLRFVPLKDENEKYYLFESGKYWRIMVFIPDAITKEAVTPESSYTVGEAFGDFEAMLADIPVELGETIKDFHNMEFRLQQLRDAVKDNLSGRAEGVKDFIDEIESRAEKMTLAERLHREGKLPKRICHCDTKVNNMMFDAHTDKVLCVIDLDTVMPSYIFSDFGDFLRYAANTSKEDEPDLSKVNFNLEIFKAFTKGYLKTASAFLTPIEKDNLPYAAELFPYMQAVRFLADYLNGDTYFRTEYPEHNLVRAKAQFKLFLSAEQQENDMKEYISSLN